MKKFFTLLCIVFFLSLQFVHAEKTYTMIAYTSDENAGTWSENLFFKRMEEKTAIHFDITQYNTKSTYNAALGSLEKSGKLPDVIFNASLSNARLEKMYQNGLISDLSDAIQKHMPNLNSLLMEYDDIKSAIEVNGKILSLPHINLYSPQNYIWINHKWLERLKLDIPMNIHEFETVLRAFRTLDPNQNGKNDEIPLSFTGVWDLSFLSHGFGIIANDFHLYNNNGVEYAPSSNAYYDFTLFLSNLYKEGLLDKDGFSPVLKLSSQDNIPKENIYGVIIAPTPFQNLPKNLGEEYIILTPLDYNGISQYRRLINRAIPGAMVISSSTKNLESLLSWADFLYSEDGGKLLTVGMENIEYKLFEDGTWDWIDGSQENLKNILSSATINIEGFLPYLEPFEFQMRFDDNGAKKILEQIEHFSQYLIDLMPDIHLSNEDISVLIPLHNAISTYTDETLSRFILGEIPLNQQSWTAYKDTLATLGLNKYIQFWNNKLKQ